MINYKELRQLRKSGAFNVREENNSGIMLAVCLLLGIILMIGGCNKAYAYSDEEYANAIYKAEGGKKTKYPYGIKSVKCTTEASCRNVCLRTIKNNRIRFKQYGYRHYSSFTQFLGSRYCPTSGSNFTASEKRLNKNWVKNVEYHLKNVKNI